MDYTLIHYNVMAWEGRAYDYCMDNLKNMGFPVDGLAFDPELVIRGLVIDKEKGNLVKADRFGYVKRAMHGISMLSTREVSEIYGRELVDLRKESRWLFLNTLFSVSEAVAYMQDKGVLPSEKLGFNIQIPSSLKKQLVDDCEFITHLAKLVQLPRSPSVNEILSKYNDYRLKNDGIIADSVSEILSGLQCYFDKALSAMLLYKNEREQYQEAIKDGVSPSVYGAEHLLRFGMLVFFGLQF
ncbi:PREDICTED: uncharacterized protein LOC109154129 [Ipomoea nil]|uniref:uncharacterized protein LOC109154129 n=1 Tax=Ipomoea nil TaxID=35883 RepID=UPI0009016F39|nr:PREDICTED: uncharacterized protein LOC109154129 [Ipomoea nil]XP_019157539.1 PREDICTED: uncharacterized protein LOC109154129 [Ipomoea nil]